SIGTFTTVYDSSERFASKGIKAYRFATGSLKGAGSPGTPLTEEQRSYFQSLIDESQQAFDSAVKGGRGLSDKQLADVRTGAVYGAETAVGKKLIDGVQPLSKTIDQLSRLGSGRPANVSSGYAQGSGGSLPMLRQELPMQATGEL